jgi:hypothetical protein
MVDIGAITINLRHGATRRDALAVVCEFVGPRFEAAELDGEVTVLAFAPDGSMLANAPADCEGWPA